MTRSIATTVVLLLVAAAAAAAPPPASLLDRLDADAFETREAASSELLAEGAYGEADLVAVLPAPGERPEVRARVLAALHHRFFAGLIEEAALEKDGGPLERAGRAALRGPVPGSLGVSHRAFPAGALPGVEPPSIAVVRTLPGFPAHGVLRPGDLIVGLNGRPVAWPDPEPVDARQRRLGGGPRERVVQAVSEAAAAFSRSVQNAGAGNDVTLRVLRGGEPLEVVLTLARADALRRLYPGGGTSLAESRWREHLGALLKPAASSG